MEIINPNDYRTFIFYKQLNGLDGWKILKRFDRPFTDFSEAIDFVNLNSSSLPFKIGLADFNKMQLDIVQWDNI